MFTTISFEVLIALLPSSYCYCFASNCIELLGELTGLIVANSDILTRDNVGSRGGKKRKSTSRLMTGTNLEAEWELVETRQHSMILEYAKANKLTHLPTLPVTLSSIRPMYDILLTPCCVHVSR